jgi:hypothetical protein
MLEDILKLGPPAWANTLRHELRRVVGSFRATSPKNDLDGLQENQ